MPGMALPSRGNTKQIGGFEMDYEARKALEWVEKNMSDYSDVAKDTVIATIIQAEALNQVSGDQGELRISLQNHLGYPLDLNVGRVN
jgi:hypothetical protein